MPLSNHVFGCLSSCFFTSKALSVAFCAISLFAVPTLTSLCCDRSDGFLCVCISGVTFFKRFVISSPALISANSADRSLLSVEMFVSDTAAKRSGGKTGGGGAAPDKVLLGLTNADGFAPLKRRNLQYDILNVIKAVTDVITD
ncbi:unnamed protein product [Brugia timori]|uniref:Uncharacterized protein n=1 Tax=Brugia timori TaxID=42155 RepID=A0A3P7T4M1_9BILA|nr:unnamed protein product [Brugia timori]